MIRVNSWSLALATYRPPYENLRFELGSNLMGSAKLSQLSCFTVFYPEKSWTRRLLIYYFPISAHALAYSPGHDSSVRMCVPTSWSLCPLAESGGKATVPRIFWNVFVTWFCPRDEVVAWFSTAPANYGPYRTVLWSWQRDCFLFQPRTVTGSVLTHLCTNVLRNFLFLTENEHVFFHEFVELETK